MTAHPLGAISMLELPIRPAGSSRTPSSEDRKTINHSQFRVALPARPFYVREKRQLKVVPCGRESFPRHDARFLSKYAKM